MPEKRKSTNEPIEFVNVRVDDTMNGASAVVVCIFDDEPMCMLITVPVSSQASKNGSQKRSLSWTDGRPSFDGSSENVTAKQPLERRTTDFLWPPGADPTAGSW